MKLSDINIDELTPMMQQYAEIKLAHQEEILFFRLGEFYEMFFEDALLASQALEIALTGKNAGLSDRIPMCGVPAHSYLSYLEKLVSFGYKVAICEQLDEPGVSKIVKRGVTSIVTPGTIIKDDVSVSYIGSSYKFNQETILTYANVSTGELYAKVVLGDLTNELLKLDIKELVCEENFANFESKGIVVSEINEVVNYDELYGTSDLKFHFGVNLLMTYIEKSYGNKLSHFKCVEIIDKQDTMNLNLLSINTLELIKTIRTGKKFGSLFWYLDNTSTAMGSRMLRSWIENPLVDKAQIVNRQQKVETFIKNFYELNDLREALKNVYDLERICAKVSVGSANPRDLIWLKNSLDAIKEINEIIRRLKLDECIEEFDDLILLLENSIDEDSPITIKDGGVIKTGYNHNLDEIRAVANDGKNFLVALEEREKKRTGIKNLKIKYNKVFGYFIEISKGNLHLIQDEWGYVRKQTLANNERFITSELKEEEDRILNAQDNLIKQEQDLFLEIKNIVKTYIFSIQQAASLISNLDCICALAFVAERDKLVKPTFNDEQLVNIKDCKHPVVEKATNTLFVENDIMFSKDQSVMIITGPNMSGKSTYMRQMALTAIMAQIGSYVACSYASTMIFDAIYTRIGASDDLSSGNSTFMLEMMEANTAILSATENSLILFDELGRGTSTYDGMSISHAIIEYISKEIKAKTFFSTHYHELTSLENEHIFNVHASCSENDGQVIFKHKIEQGPTDKSYGIYVASLANLNQQIIDTSYKVLEHYESMSKEGGDVKIEYVEKVSQVEEEIKNVDINTLTPLDAFNLILKLKSKL